MKTLAEFEELQQKIKTSGLSVTKFLKREHICTSTYFHWKRKYSTNKHTSTAHEQALVPVTISNTRFSNIINNANELTLCFPNGIKCKFL